MHDFAVIGSGVSGGRLVHELTRAGAKCVLLEAGHEYTAATFPDNEMDYSTQMFWGGGLELSTDGRLGFLRGKCLGGTSVLNQALLDRFDGLAWDDWKARSGVDYFSCEEMEKHYLKCQDAISISEIPPEYYNRNAKIFTQAFDDLGYGWQPLQRGQTDCRLDQGSDCIVCLGGCPRDSKQSSLITTIRQARTLGLAIHSNFEVDHLVDETSQVRIFGRQKGEKKEITASHVVLAAGALGNTAILLRSGFHSPSLGTGFSCHPQFMTYAVFKEPVNAHKGAFQAVKSNDGKLRAAGYKLENVFAPPIGTAMLMPGYGTKHHDYMKKYRYMASMEVAIRDEPVGRVRLSKNGKLLIDKKLTEKDEFKSRKGLEVVRELFSKSGAHEIIACEQGFGLHLMGGCPIGADPKYSVVDPEFKLHGHPRISAADSSIFPSAPGINPSFTIMALSQRAGENLVRR